MRSVPERGSSPRALTDGGGRAKLAPAGPALGEFIEYRPRGSSMKSLPTSRLPLLCLALIGLCGCPQDERDFTSGTAGAGGTGGEGGGGGGGAGGGSQGCSLPEDCPAAGPNEEATCIAGVCGVACAAGFADCDTGAPGCESTTAKENCGACGVACATECAAEGSEVFCNDPIDISAGYNHTCVIRRDGTLWCWGRNQVGELGLPASPPVLAPTLVPLPGKAVKVAAGGGQGSPNPAHTCVILEDTTVYCWGSGSFGQLGMGGNVAVGEPKQVTSLVNVVDLAAGGKHTCAVKKDGDLYCWGADNRGQLGNPSMQNLSTPGLIMSGVKQVDGGEQHTCAVMMTGGLKCWGENGEGALGTGEPEDPTDRQLPTDVVTPLLDGVEEVAVGDRHTCARKKNEVYCFGNDYNGACGAQKWGPLFTPTLVAVPEVMHVAVGRERSGAVWGANGSVKMWGVKELGDGMEPLSGTPLDVKLTGVVRLAGGYEHTCALKSNGEVWCWGEDAEGQLGDSPDFVTQPTPVKVIFELAK